MAELGALRRFFTVGQSDVFLEHGNHAHGFLTKRLRTFLLVAQGNAQHIAVRTEPVCFALSLRVLRRGENRFR